MKKPIFTGGTIKVNLGVIGVEGNWAPDEREREAAWEMYVELATRIAVVELKPDEGLLCEALDSFYSLFQTTREILKKYSPSVARPKGKDAISFGHIAVAVLNQVIRPVLAKWHPLLVDYENKRSPSVSIAEHEQNWLEAPTLRRELNDTRLVLIRYADTLAEVAGVPSLIVDNSPIQSNKEVC
ncbi:MAG: hypothetical protein ACXV7G_11005 [Halobacteriota archaeon]